MALARNSESVADLYMRLGLSIDELEQGFVDAGRTIRDNMARLSRENRIIELQMQVDLEGLDDAADAQQILQIRTQALTRQIENQRQRVELASAELRNMAQSTGENSDQTQRAQLQFEHERLALARLEEQLNSLNETQDDANAGANSFMDRISELSGRFAPYIAAIGSAVATTQELIEKYAELQKQAYELNMPFERTKDLLRQIKFAGGDIGDFEGFIRGITDAYVKGEVDDPEFIALSKYGAKITDATGRLKDFKDITEEVYQAYLKAKDAGEEIEFLQLVGGESGIRDAIQLFERYAEAKEDAAKVFDSGVDPKQMHEASRALNLVTEQFGELKDAIVSIITPEVTEGLQRFFAVLHEGTRFIVENKEVLTLLSTPTLGPIDLAEKLIGLRAHLLGLPSALKETAVSWADFKRNINDDVDKKDNNPLSQYAQQRINNFKAELEELRIELDFAGNEYQQAIAKLNLWRRNETKDKLHLSDEERLAVAELYSAKLDQIEKTRADKLDEIRERIAQADRTALENKIAGFEKLKEEMIAAGMSEKEAVELTEKQKIAAIEELETDFNERLDGLRQNNLQRALAAADAEKKAWIDKGIDEARASQLAEQVKAKAIADAMEKTNSLIRDTAAIEYGLTHDAFEKQIYDIERLKDAQLQKAETAQDVAAIITNAAMREADTFDREMDRIQGRIESAQDRLARLALSQYDFDLYSAEKQFKKDIKDKIPYDIANEIYNLTVRQAKKRAVEDKTGRYLENPAASERARKLVYADAENIAFKSVLDNIERSSEAASLSVRQAVDIFKALNSGQRKYVIDPRAAQSTKGFDVMYGDRSSDRSSSSYVTDSAVEPQIQSISNQLNSIATPISDLNTQLLSFANPIDTIIQQLSTISQQIYEIASRSAETQQNVNITQNLDVNLGGAYVFDDAMKTQLTNDITTNVCNSITDVFNKATTHQNYGYAR